MTTLASRTTRPEPRRREPVSPAEARAPRQPVRGAFDAPPPPPSPARELARRALGVLRRARLASPPERWLRPGFGREVDLVRLHLGPVRTRAGLASSFGREAFNLAVDDSLAAAAPVGPVHVAYALRWLEIGDGRVRPCFTEWLADPAERSLR
jgi:hypothetical protein